MPNKHKAGSHKDRRQLSNQRRGKYKKAFIRCVRRTGKWRCKKVDPTFLVE